MPSSPAPSSQHQRLDATTVVPAHLQRRLVAAGIDIGVVGLCCAMLFLSFNPVFASPVVWLWRPAAVVLSAVAAVELFTGITPGKWLAGLTLRTVAGARPPVWALVLRGLVRLAPVGLFLVSLRVRDTIGWMFLLQVLIVLVGTYLTVCYMTLWRRGTTLFDAAARTRAVRASST